MSRNSFINTQTVSSRWRDIEPSNDNSNSSDNSNSNDNRIDDRNGQEYPRQSYPGGRFVAFTEPKAPEPPKVFDLDGMKDEFPALGSGD